MRKDDARKLDHKTLEEMRMRTVIVCSAVGLRQGDKEKPSAIEVRVCAVDTRDGCEADQGQVPYRLERGVGRAASGSTRHTCQKPLHRVQERDEALVQQWLKKDYPKIRKIAQKQGGEIYFGDAAHIRSDHHAGCTWGKKGETLIVETKGALHNMRLISAISSRGHMRFMIKQQGGVNASVFIEFLNSIGVLRFDRGGITGSMPRLVKSSRIASLS
jgi:hypothetical protein